MTSVQWSCFLVQQRSERRYLVTRIEDGESWRIISKVSTLKPSDFLLLRGFEVDLDLYIYCLLAQERHLISPKNVPFENRYNFVGDYYNNY